LSQKVVIIGGVAGGASAAARLRRLDEEAEIILFERDEYISFANCGLPYYIGEVIKKRDNLLVQTPKGMRERFRVDVRVNSEVTRIRRETKSVEVLDRKTGKTYTETYDKLILAPGAAPFRPPIPGLDEARVFSLRNIPDTDTIKGFVDEHKPSKAVVVGAGYIGLEMAENLRFRGVEVTVVELADRVLPGLDFEMSALIYKHLLKKEVGVITGNGVKAILPGEDAVTVELADERQIEADLVILGLGVKPETKLAAEAGLKLGVTGGIAVDEHLATSDPDIYALGDAIEVKTFVSGEPALIPLAGPANKQGRMVADIICGRDQSYNATQGTAILKVFDMSVAVTGLNEDALRRAGLDYRKSIIHTASHANYYPGASTLSIKLLFAPADGKLLGAQVVGADGVDKTMDVLAVAMRAGLTVRDLEALELSYAPPFSSAKSPVNVAGYVASNILKGDCDVFYWDDIAAMNKETSILLDVRSSFEFKKLGTIEGALNIPIDKLRDKIEELPKDKDIYLFCQVGLRAYLGCRVLNQKGYRTKNLSGGYKTFKAANEVRAASSVPLE
jgi:NADPH-dependent 2,4-dienoyl-CoA reductase/sulfur reductase-like enzyme/rhodanese-related sulfurtransferase